MKPLDLLSALCSEQHASDLEERFGRNTLTAFQEMLARGRELTEKQATWVQDIGEKMGLVTAPGANLFSRLSPKEQERQRRAAAVVKLPWER